MFCSGVGIAEAPTGERRDDIRGLLLEQQHQLLNEIQRSVRDVREAGSNNQHHTTYPHETVEAEPEDDLVFAVLQLKAETLERVNEAVRHVDEGTYGYCVDCHEAIAPSRLRVMPFAVRCRDCEEIREDDHDRECARMRSRRIE